VVDNIQLLINNGTTGYQIGSFAIPAGAGTYNGSTNVSSIDIIQLLPIVNIDNAGNKYIALEYGFTLQVSLATPISTGKVIFIQAYGKDF